MRIVIVGGGVVGLTTACVLQEAGHEVVVVEQADGVGQGASRGNGAQLSYGFAAPLAGPGIIPELPRILLAPRAGVRFRPRREIAQWRWAAAFLAACTARRSFESTRRLLALAAQSRARLHRLLETVPLQFAHRRAGKLVIHRSARAFQRARRGLDQLGEHAPSHRVLGRDECIAIEPFLEQAQKHIAGGMYTPDDEVGDCYLFCAELARHITRDGTGASVLLGVHAEWIEIREGRARAVAAGGQRIEGDAIVLANGMGAPRLAATAGLRLPIHPLHGYSLTLPASAHGTPSTNITDFERRLVLAPLGNTTRIAGFLDLGGRDEPPDISRCAHLADAARDFVGEIVPAECQPWAGTRAATPSGLPIVGATPVRGLFLNAGHGGLGFTLAMGCAELIRVSLSNSPWQ